MPKTFLVRAQMPRDALRQTVQRAADVDVITARKFERAKFADADRLRARKMENKRVGAASLVRAGLFA